MGPMATAGTLDDAIKAVMRKHGTVTVAEIAKATGRPKSSIRKALVRGSTFHGPYRLGCYFRNGVQQWHLTND